MTPDDPLVDTAQCSRDIALMSQLGANAIRVYHVDPEADHSGCMTALANAGIYLFVDLDTFDTAIQQDTPTWNETQFHAFSKVLDAFHQFDNTAGVFIGNEVLDTAAGSRAAPYVLAAARDIKAYRDKQGYRKIPVGYAAADIAQLRPMLQNYLACSSNASDRVDFFSLNAYEWCGDSSYTLSGYNMLEKNATGYPVPIFFSETGCNTVPPRTFTDQQAIFGPHMADTWSGAIIYEWIEETNNYGLISYGPAVAPTDTASGVVAGYTRQGTPTPVSPDFQNLQSQWATLSPSGVALSDYTNSLSAITPPPCPSSTSGGWAVNPSSPLPTLGQVYHSSGGQDSQPTATSGSSDGESSSSSSSTSDAKSSHHHENSGARGPTPAGSDALWTLSMLLCGMVGVAAWWL